MSQIARLYGVKSFVWKSGGVKSLTNIMSAQMHSHDLVWQRHHFADFMNVNRQWIGGIPEYRPFAADAEGNWWNFLTAVRLSTSRRVTLYITDYHCHHWGPLYANPLIPSQQENRLKTSCHSRVPANKLTWKKRQKLFSCHFAVGGDPAIVPAGLNCFLLCSSPFQTLSLAAFFTQLQQTLEFMRQHQHGRKKRQ